MSLFDIFLYTIPLGPAEKARPVKAGSHNLYYHLNDLNAEKFQPSGDMATYVASQSFCIEH